MKHNTQHPALPWKCLSKLFVLGLLGLLFGSAAPFTQAATLTWDPSGSGTGSDGAGNWNTTAGNTVWATGSADQVWANSTTVGAVIGAGTGAAGTITVASGITASNITINAAGSGNYTLSGGSITLTSSASNILVHDSATINATGGLTNFCPNVDSGKTLTLSSGLTANGSNPGFLNPNNLTTPGTAGAGLVKLTAGGFTLGANAVHVGNGSTTSGGLEVSGTSTLWAVAGFQIGRNSASGLCTVSGGTINGGAGNSQLTIARSGFDGALVLNSGTVTYPVVVGTAAVAAFVGRSQVGIHTGTLTVNGGNLNVSGCLEISGDTSTTGTGTLNLAGGVNNIGQIACFGANNNTGTAGGGTGIANLNVSGGTTYIGATNSTDAGAILGGSGITDRHSTAFTTGGIFINLSGGTLGAGTNWSSPLPMTLANTSGGITFKTASASAVVHNITLSGVLSGAGGLTETGSGTLTLSGANTYSGATTINNGTLALSGSGSVSSSSSINIAAGASLDVSGLSSSTFNLGSTTTIRASGTGTTVGTSAAAIKGAPSGTVNLGSQAITLTYDGSHPALYISQGALNLSGNAITVNASSPLGVGSYVIIQQASGNVIQSGTFTAAGTAIPGNATGSISFTNGNVYLIVASSATATTTTLSSLSPITYGNSVTYTATVSPTPDGGTVQFFDNGVALGSPVAVDTSTGQVSLTVSPAAGNHLITAGYSGDANFTASTTSGASTQVVNQVTVTVVSGLSVQDHAYDGTTSAILVSNNVVLSGVLPADTANVSLPITGYTANFASANIGSSISVTVSGLNLAGNAAGNYSLMQPSGLTGNIVAPALATLTWDFNGATPPNDGSGTWDTTTANWYIGGLVTNWLDGSSAVIGTGSGSAGSYAVALSTPMNVNTLAFNAPGSYILSGSSLTLTNQNGTDVTVAAGVTAEIDSAFTVPGSTANFGSGAKLTLAGGGAVSDGGNWIFNTPSGSAGTLDIKGGAYCTNGAGMTLWVQNANVTQEAATMNYGGGRPMIGYSGNGTYTINDPNAVITQTGTGNPGFVGRNGFTGSMTLQNGSASLASDFYVGYDLGSQGTLNISGGMFNISSKKIIINKNATTATAFGTLNISGGTTLATGISFGDPATANTFTGGSAATLKLTGGWLYLGAGGIAQNALGTLAVTNAFSGGTVGASADWSSSLPITFGTIGGNVTFQAADTNNTAHNITLSGVLSGAGGLTKTANGILTLSGVNTYSGNTVINGGTLALSGSGSINSSTGISIAAGGTLDVSGLSSTTFNFSAALSASGGASSATINGASGGTVNLGSQPITLTYDGSHPALSISQGTLSLNGNAFTVNSGSPLPAGTYVLVQQTSGSISSSGSYSVSGTAVGGIGTTSSISVNGNSVILTVENITTTALILSSGSNPSAYGDVLTFQATVSPAPADGETITFNDGVATVGTGTIAGGVATLSISSLVAASHSITAVYPGDANNLGSTSSALTQTVNKATPAITTSPMGTAITYGQTLANSTLSGGAASTTGSFVFTDTTIAPLAGSTNVSVTFSPTDAANYNPASVTVAVTVNKSTPTLTAPSATAITYGQTLAVSMLSGGAATNAFNSSSVIGSFAFADTSIAPDAGSTNVSVTFTPIDTMDYNPATVTIAVTVNKATPSVGIVSTENPSGYGDSVAFTVTLPADATGSLVFSSPGGAFSTNSLSSGSATSLAITNLLRGTNLITAVYSGDDNYAGIISTLNQVVTNHSPVANPLTITRVPGVTLEIALSDLATNWTDADGDAISFVSADTSTNGVVVTTNGGFVLYNNPNNVNDQFTYTISDSQGATAIGVVSVIAGQPQNIVGVVNNGDGSKTISFSGTPNYTYRVQATTNLASPLWINISTNMAGMDGLWQVTDWSATNYPARYYRSVYP